MRGLLALSVFTVLTLMVSAAVAEWTLNGTGLARAKAGVVKPLTVTAATPTGLLYAGHSGDVALTISNANPMDVTARQILGNGPITSDKAGCDATTSQVSFTDQAGTWVVPRGGKLAVTLTGAATMGTDSAVACQGATFSIPIQVSVGTAPPPPTTNHLVLVGDHGTIRSSADGTAWTTRASGTTNDLRAVASNGATWVAVGFNGTVLTSPDGVTWTSPTTLDGSPRSVAWNGVQWLIGDDNGFVYTSPDAVIWTSHPTGSSINYLGSIQNTVQLGMAWTGSSWVGVSNWNIILTSPDAATWTPRNSTIDVLHGVAAANSEVVAVGELGSILQSSDGTSWVGRVSGTTSTLLGVAANPTEWVAVGRDSTVLTSPDAGNWLAQVGSPGDWNGVVWAGSRWVVVGNGGTMQVSPDATTWSGLVPVSADNLNAVAYRP